MQKKCEVYWPESADEAFIPTPGSPLTVEYKSMLPYAEFVIRKMVVTHVSVCVYLSKEGVCMCVKRTNL